jgi:hypothetical protein
MSAPARVPPLLYVFVAALVSFPRGARAHVASSTSSAFSSSFNDFSYLKGLLATGSVATTAHVDGRRGLLDGLSCAGTRRLAEGEAKKTAENQGTNDSHKASTLVHAHLKAEAAHVLNQTAVRALGIRRAARGSNIKGHCVMEEPVG